MQFFINLFTDFKIFYVGINSRLVNDPIETYLNYKKDCVFTRIMSFNL